MQLPKRRTRKKRDTGRGPVRCPSHLKWIRGHECCAYGRASGNYDANVMLRHGCEGRMEAHHVKTRGAGGGDDETVPLCSFHHAQLDSPGWSQKRFEAVYLLDLKAIAQALADRSQALKKLKRAA